MGSYSESVSGSSEEGEGFEFGNGNQEVAFENSFMGNGNVMIGSAN